MLKGRTLYILWHTTDIIDRAKERGIDLSIQDAKQILKNLDRNHDATIGINWGVIDFVTDNYIETTRG